ncbi:hypothetical protein MAPG_10254 [Magnaporthiopsis poae ATCC 64411]|uniref:Heterokaryon incompatibility domain-containing protein n=1 Tax=Magnaporthiopsis poae (strain ATCC 64411 / 73-15) TaxID=644358 RepID=A0A0C4EC40_MAGP6|nr:hypothetical protein MAPG_10254 [Magnaporthiopsis poae ATCC 64411]
MPGTCLIWISIMATPDASASASSGSFPNSIYSPLDTSQRQFRLLQLVGSKATPRYRLRSFPLDSAPTYMALSYVWGDASKTRDIVVNNRKHPVTLNLAAALQHIRAIKQVAEQESPPFLWVDALCIDQSKNKEKSHQVAQMGAIYTNAWLVISWLGPDVNGDLALAIKAFRAIAKESVRAKHDFKNLDWMEKYPMLINTDYNPGDEDNEDNEDLNQIDEMADLYFKGLGKTMETQADVLFDTNLMDDDHMDDQHSVEATDSQGSYVKTSVIGIRSWDAILDFFRVPYWSRVWVIQEMALARHRVVLAGTTFISDTVLQLFYHFMKQLLPGQVAMPRCIAGSARWRLETALLALQPGTVLHTIDLLKSHSKRYRELPDGVKEYRALVATAAFKATNPLDKVYAIRDVIGSSITPNYDRSLEDLFCELAISYIASADDLQILLRSERPPGAGPSSSTLPSWVPNWQALSSRNKLVAGWKSKADSGLCDAHADAGARASIIHHRWLEATGCVCETVAEVEREHKLKGDEIFQFAIQQNKRPGGDRYPTGIPRLLAILRTIVVDYTLNPKSPWGTDTAQLQGVLLAALTWVAGPRPWTPDYGKVISAWLGELGITVGGADSVARFFEALLPGLPADQRWTSVRQAVEAGKEWGHRVFVHYQTCSDGFRLFSTSSGYIGWVPDTAQAGDKICVLVGCTTPVVMREEENGSYYTHVGPCFILGFMEGEAAEKVRSGELAIHRFEIH